MFSPVVNNLEMKLCPRLLRKMLFQIVFGLNNILAACQFPSCCQAMNMRIDRKGGASECLAHNDPRRFVPDARQFLKVLEGTRNLAVILANQYLAHVANRKRLSRTESTRSNNRLDFFYRLPLHVIRIVRQFPQVGRNAIDHLVRALRTENDGNQQSVGIDMFQRYFWIGIKLIKPMSDVVRSFLSIHGLLFYALRICLQAGNPRNTSRAGYLLGTSSL